MNNEELEKIEKFDKNQLSKLISDIRDINSYTSFKNGAFIYDLGKYQGSLLINHIEELEDRINKAIEYIENHCLYQEEYDYDYEENLYLSGIEDSYAKEDLLEILKGNDYEKENKEIDT